MCVKDRCDNYQTNRRFLLEYGWSRVMMSFFNYDKGLTDKEPPAGAISVSACRDFVLPVVLSNDRSCTKSLVWMLM